MVDVMKKCRDCGKEVSISAKSCPHCGADDPGMGNLWFSIKMLLSIGMLGCCMYLLYVVLRLMCILT